MEQEKIIEELLHAIERHRLIFLYVAFPERRNPANAGSRCETLYRDELPINRIPSEKIQDEESLFGYEDLLNQFADLAIGRFGPGKGCKPIRTVEGGKEIEVEGGSCPYWTIDEMGRSVLSQSTDKLLTVCREAIEMIVSGDGRLLVEAIQASAYPRGQTRWSSSIVIPWDYLDTLDRLVMSIKMIPGTNRKTPIVTKAERLIGEIRKLICLPGKFEFCPDFHVMQITKILDIPFWVENVFYDDENILSSIKEFSSPKDATPLNKVIQSGVEKIIVAVKALILELKPGMIYEELNWLGISNISSGICSERLRIHEVYASLIIQSEKDPKFAANASLAAKAMDTILFMLLQSLYNVVQCCAKSAMLWLDLDLNAAYLWLIERIKTCLPGSDAAQTVNLDSLPDRIPMGEDDDIGWQVMWENHWQSDIADAISHTQNALLKNATEISESDEWSKVIQQYKDQLKGIDESVSKHEKISQNALNVLCKRSMEKRGENGEMPKSQAPAGESGKPTHSSDFTTCNWYGIKYRFNKTQARVVELLWMEWEKGTPTLKDNTIGQKIGSEAERYRVQHTFREHPAFGTMIKSNNKGIYHLAPPESPQKA
jgi:hypothetical protein